MMSRFQIWLFLSTCAATPWHERPHYRHVTGQSGGRLRKVPQGRGKPCRVAGDPRVKVKHRVDATRLVSKMKKRSFDCVVWIFPYPLGKGVIFGDSCEELMRGFFRSVDSVLEDGGQVQVTLARGQGGRGFHSSTFQLTMNTSCGIIGYFR